MASGQVTNGGHSSLLSQPARVSQALMSLTSLGWDRSYILGPWVSGKQSPWKGGDGEDQCWGWTEGASEVGLRKSDAHGSLPFLLTPAETGAGTLTLDQLLWRKPPPSLLGLRRIRGALTPSPGTT